MIWNGTRICKSVLGKTQSTEREREAKEEGEEEKEEEEGTVEDAQISKLLFATEGYVPKW